MAAGIVRVRVADWADGLRERFRQAVRNRGPDRDLGVELIKGIAASVVSYLVASRLLDSPMPAFAPITALLVIQVTLYRSLLSSLRYTAAVTAGIACAAGLAHIAGENVATLAVFVLAGLAIGRWRRFGHHGPQVAVAGLFVLATGAANNIDYLWRLLLTVAIGAAAGVAANALAAPVVHFRDPADTIHDLASALGRLLLDIANGLREDSPLERNRDWQQTAVELDQTVQRARTQIEYGEDGASVNPRLLLSPGRAEFRAFSRHHAVVSALARVTEQLQAITRALSHLADDTSDDDSAEVPGTDGHRSEFLISYADLLGQLASIIRAFGQPQPGHDDRVAELLDHAESHYDNVVRHVQTATAHNHEWHLLGTLAVDAGRIFEELHATPE